MKTSFTPRSIQVSYSASVFVPANWRQVRIEAMARQISPGMAEVAEVLAINGEVPSGHQSRTGAARQRFNGQAIAAREVGARKRLSTCDVLEAAA
jgi:hypothetical protein